MKTFKLIGFNLSILIFLLIIVEIFLRITNPNYQYYYRSHPKQPDLNTILAKTDTNWLQVDSLMGWVCQQKSILHFPTPPYEGVRYQINREGFRNAHGFQDSVAAHKKRILLLGDSFMFGIYLKEEQTIANKLQVAKGDDYIFYNISIPGWGLDQIYLAYQRYIDLINPDQVILAFVDDDLMRSLEILFHGCGRKPSLKISDNHLVENNENPLLWEYLCWNNQIGNRLLVHYYQHQAAELAKFMLNDIIQSEHNHNRSPLFIRIPAWIDLHNQEPREIFCMNDFMSKKEVKYMQLYDTLSLFPESEFSKLYIPDDGHFTEAGAAFTAKKILELLD